MKSSSPSGNPLPNARVDDRDGRRTQRSLLRAARAESTEPENIEGWFTTIVARVCLNLLRQRTLRRERPLPSSLPDPIISEGDQLQPEDEALLAESVGLARPMIPEMSSKGSPSMSCNTKARRSGGDSVPSTTCSCLPDRLRWLQRGDGLPGAGSPNVRVVPSWFNHLPSA